MRALGHMCILFIQKTVLLIFVVKNTNFFKTNSDVHGFNTRSHYDFNIPAANLAVFQKGVWYSGIKIYNHPPQTLKQLSYDICKFKVALKRFLYTYSFTRWRSIIAGNRDLVSFSFIHLLCILSIHTKSNNL